MTQIKDPSVRLYYMIVPIERLGGYLRAGGKIPQDDTWWGYGYPPTRMVVDNLAGLLLSGKQYLKDAGNEVLISTEDRKHGFNLDGLRLSDRLKEHFWAGDALKQVST